MKHQHKFRIFYAPKDSREITVAEGIITSNNFFEASTQSTIQKIIFLAEVDENKDLISSFDEEGNEKIEIMIKPLDINLEDNIPEADITDINILNFNLYHI